MDSFSINSSPPCPQLDLLALDAMLNENIISGQRMENGSGFPVQFLMVTITIKGRSLLEEMEQKESGLIALPKQVEILKQQIKEKDETPHTLLNYWRLADWGERCGMLSIFSGVFLFGYLCSKMSLVSRVIDLIRDVTP